MPNTPFTLNVRIVAVVEPIFRKCEIPDLIDLVRIPGLEGDLLSFIWQYHPPNISPFGVVHK